VVCWDRRGGEWWKGGGERDDGVQVRSDAHLLEAKQVDRCGGAECHIA